MIPQALAVSALAVLAAALPAYGAVGYYINDFLDTSLSPGDTVNMRWLALGSYEEYTPVTFSVSGEGARFITLHTGGGEIKEGEPLPAEFTISIPEDAMPGEYGAKIRVQAPPSQVPNAINVQGSASQTFTITVLGDPVPIEDLVEGQEPAASGHAAPLKQLGAGTGPGDVQCNGERRLYLSQGSPLCLLPLTQSVLDDRGYPFG